MTYSPLNDFLHYFIAGLTDTSSLATEHSISTIGAEALKLGALGRARYLEVTSPVAEPVADERTLCERFGHTWEWFYIRQGGKPFCRRCGLETHS